MEIQIETVQTVNLTSHLMAQNAVTVPGMSLVLIVPPWKLIIIGIALVVFAQVMVRQFVEMDSVQVMKPMKHDHQIAMHLVNVMLVKYLTVTVAMNAGPKAG